MRELRPAGIRVAEWEAEWFMRGRNHGLFRDRNRPSALRSGSRRYVM
jgi:hypothetical protein